jgi:enamine deaminase RidA (YjgF/YER057c/UK114 family)
MMKTTSEGRRARRLAELGIVLPKPAVALGSYVPWVKTGSLLFVSGQIALDYLGTVGAGISLEDGKRAARQAALNVIAQAASALDGDLDRVTRVVKVTGFVHAPPASPSMRKSSTALRIFSRMFSARRAVTPAPPWGAIRFRAM